MTTRKTRRQSLFSKGFTGGTLNTTDNPIIVPATDMVEAKNVLLGSRNARRKRGGTVKYNTSGDDATANYPTNPDNGGGGTDPIFGIYEFHRYDTGSGAPRSDVMVRQGTKVWSINARNVAAVDRTGALVLSGAATRAQFQSFESAAGPSVYFCSNVTSDGLNKWDGAAAAAVAITTPAADWTANTSGPSILTVHKGKLWAAGVPEFRYRLYYSVTRDGDDFATAAPAATAAGSLDFDAIGDPVGITGLVSFQNRLYVFMRTAIYELSGNDPTDFVVRTVSSEVGCIGQNTIQIIGNDVIYASERGVLSLKSTDKAIESEYGFLSRPISRSYNEQLDRNLLDDQAHSAYDEQEQLYLLSVPSLGSTTNDIVLAYNFETDAWADWDGFNARSMAKVLVNNQSRIVLGQEDGRIVLTGDSTRQDLGSNFTTTFKTGIFYPSGDADIQHVFKSVTILAATDLTADVTMTWNIDGKFSQTKAVNLTSEGDLLGSTFILGSSKLAVSTFVPRTLQIVGKGYGLQIQLNMTGSADVEIYGFIIESEPADYKYV